MHPTNQKHSKSHKNRFWLSDRWKVTIQRFRSINTIHGITEILSDSSPSSLRIIWTVFLICAVGITVNHSIIMIESYFQYPTKIIIMNRSVPSSVVSLFCPIWWTTKSVIARQNISHDFFAEICKRIMFKNNADVDVCGDSGVMVNDDDFRIKLSHHKYNSLSEAIQAITPLPTKLFSHVNLNENNNVTFDIKQTMNGPCYRIEGQTTGSEGQFSIRLHKPNDILDVFNTPQMNHKIFFGSNANQVLPVGGTLLGTFDDYQITLEASEVHRYDTPRYRCINNGHVDQVECLMQCLTNASSSMCKFYLTTAPKEIEHDIKHCTADTIKKNAYYFREEVVNNCVDKCNPPCRETKLRPFVNALGRPSYEVGQNASQHFTISIHNNNRVLAQVEKPLITKNKLISNIGTVMSLYCGASFMSLFQLGYFILVQVVLNGSDTVGLTVPDGEEERTNAENSKSKIWDNLSQIEECQKQRTTETKH